MATRNPPLADRRGSTTIPERLPKQPVPVSDIQNLPSVTVTNSKDVTVERILKQGHILVYFVPAGKVFYSTYGLCAMLRSVISKGAVETHMVSLDNPSSVVPFKTFQTYTFSELADVDNNLRILYNPNAPKNTDVLMQRNWNKKSITEFLHAIITLLAEVVLIQNTIQEYKDMINWGYIDSDGNSSLHKACIYPKSRFFLGNIIQHVSDHKTNPINHLNNDGQTPLALLVRYIYATSSYGVYKAVFPTLLDKGAKILVQDLSNQTRRPIMENFTIQRIGNGTSLAILFIVQQSRMSGNHSMYAYISEPDKIIVDQTQSLTSISDFSSTVRKDFNIILDLNCSEVLDYIFRSKNSPSKTKIDPPQIGESFLNIAAGECNSPLLFEHFIQDITDWNPKKPNENVLHICLSKMKFENFYLLLNKIPVETLNTLLFAKNSQNIIPIISMMDIPNTELCTQLVIKKGCLDPDNNNLAHVGILCKKLDFLNLVIKCSGNPTFTHTNNDGFNPLHFAIQRSSVEATLLLLDKSDRPILTSRDKDGYNCLHSAIIHFNIDIFKAVLGVMKCDTVNGEKIVNIQTGKDIKTTPFLLSIENQCLEATELLLSSGANIDTPDSRSQHYPLYIQNYCHGEDHLQTVLRLTLNKRNCSLESEGCIEDLNFNGSPLLFYPWRYPYLERFKEICAAFSFKNLVKCNEGGNTILHLSLYDDKLTEFLLGLFSHFLNDHKKEIINFLNTKNKKGETVLSLAVTSSKHTAVQTILSLGASLNIEFPGGDNILHIAIRAKNREAIAILLSHPEIGQLLCKPNNENETPITSLLKSDGTGTIGTITNVGNDIRGPNGESILHLVVQNGDEQTLRELFKLEGFSWSNLKDKNNRTPLHYAVVFSKAYAIKLLIECRYGIFTLDKDDTTPIHEAVKRKDEKVWKEMFKILVSPNHSSRLPILLQVSVKMNNFNATRDILTLKPDLTPDKDNNSIIHLAAKSPEQAAILKHLLQTLPKEQSDQMLKSFNNEQLAPLHFAVYHNNVEGAKILKDHGSPIAVMFKGELSFFCKKFENRMVLYKAHPPDLKYFFGYVMKQGVENIIILAEIPTFKSTNIYTESELSKVNGLIPIQDLPLFLKSSCIDLISYLIQYNHVRLTYTDGTTLSHYAAQFGTTSIMQYLISKRSCDLFTLDKQDNSILYYVLQNSDPNVLHETCNLIVRSAKSSKHRSFFETSNLKGQRILEVCLELRNIEGFKYLMQHHVSDILYSNLKGDTLLHQVIKHENREEFIGPLFHELNRNNQTELAQYINRTDRNKLTSLHFAIIKHSNNIVNLLLKHNADPCIVGKHERNCLHYAVTCKIPEETLKLIILSLLEYPKLLEMKDQSDQTPIFSCIIENNVPALTLFIEHPINFHEEDIHKKTIMDCSIEKKSSGIWSIIFPKFRAAVESKYIVASTLKKLLEVCMCNDNTAAFTGILGLKQCTTYAEQEWRPLIEFSIRSAVNTFFLAQIIIYLKMQKHLDMYFYPKSNNFTPPLLVAIQRSKVEAIKLMVQENISLSFTRSNNCLTLYSENPPSPLVICKNRLGDVLLTGYKIDNSAMYVLVTLPDLGNTSVYEDSKVTELKSFTTLNLTPILQSVCIEPIKSVIDLPSRYKLSLNEGYTLIQLAAKVASIEVLRYLLAKSSEIFDLDQNGNSILYYALLNNITIGILKYLCDYLVDELKDFNQFNCENAEGKRILDICIEKDDISSFCVLLNPKYQIKLDYTDSRRYTLFHKLIILKTSVDFFKRLHVRTHSTEEYQHLSSQPVEPSRLTSLHLAISENLHEHIDFMLKQKYDLCTQSESGSYPIHIAVLNNFETEKIIRIIDVISNGKVTSVVNAQNNEGFTPLILAVRNGNIHTVDALLKIENITIDAVDNLGRNALHHSILLKEDEFNLELLKLFLTYRTLLERKDSNGLTPLHYCVIQENTEALDLVLQNDQKILNENNEKENLIHLSIQSDSIPVWKRVFEELQRCSDQKSIIEMKLNDETILVYCIKKNNLTAFSDILTLKPDIDAIDSEGNTPLHHAAECPKRHKILTSLIEYITKHCKDRLEQLFSALNMHNLAPFHYAIWKNNLSAIDIFMSHKAPFVIEKNSKLTLCALNSPLSINLYRWNNQLMIGYKVEPESPDPPVMILSQIPEMKREAIKKLANNIIKIDNLDDSQIKTILQYPSAEPIIAFLNQNLIQKSMKFENSISLLLYSAMYGTLSVVEELCKTMNLYHIDIYEETILFYAFRNKDTEVLKFLLSTVFERSKEKPASDILNAENKKGGRILEVALKNFERFSILLDEKYKIILTYTGPNGYTLLHTIMRLKTEPKFVTALLTEIQRREPGYLNKYINISSTDHQTALHLCVSNNLETSLIELLKFSPNITCEDQNGNTPLHIASKLNYKSLVTVLIEHVKLIEGDYPSFVNAVNNEKMTPLLLSVTSSNLEIAKELLAAGAEIYATDISGKTVLHHAVLIQDEGKREKVIQIIFQHENGKVDQERKLIHIQDTQNNDSPLHLAVEHSNNRTIQLLLKESPDLTLCDKKKKSALHRAIPKGHIEIIRLILNYIVEAYAKDRSDSLHILNLQDEDRNTAVHLAIDSSRDDILTELLPLHPLMNLKNNSGQTPLHIAVTKKEIILKEILKEINHSNKEKELHFYALDNTGLPPLHSAIVHNYLQSVEILINNEVALSCWEDEVPTLFNEEMNKLKFPLRFYKLQKGILRKFFSIDQILVGYQMKPQGKSIITVLPELTQTKSVNNNEVIELRQSLQEKDVINILKCASIEPIQVAIEKKLVEDKKENWLANLASEEGHENVSTYLLTRSHVSVKGFCQAIKRGVKNKTFSKLLDRTIPTTHNYQTIPELTDSSNHIDTFVHHVSITLCETMHLSLDNVTNEALNKLLSFNPCLHYAYGEKKDTTLLHLIVEKDKSSEFLEEYLEKVKVTEDQNPNTGKRIIDSKNSNSMTALNMSVVKEQLNNVRTILNYQPSVTLNDAFENSSLHFVAKTGNLEIAQLIIGYISDQNLFDNKNSDGCTPLHLATQSGSIEVCKLLLEKGVDRYSTDKTSRTILHHAILIQNATHRKSMVEYILKMTENRDNEIVRMSDDQSCIPLQCAVAKKQVGVVQLLVQFTDTMKHRNVEKQTALHLSCIHRCNENVDLIVEQITTHGDANVIDYTDKNSKTALHLSINKENHHALEKVLTAKPNLELIDASSGNTYLHTAVEIVDDPFFLKNILTYLSEDSIRNLLTHLNDIELPPLQYAILRENFLAANILVGKGAKLNFQKQGRTRLCDDKDKLELKVVTYKSQCWVGFEIRNVKKSHFVITQLPSLTGDTFVSADESRGVKPYDKRSITSVTQQISECESSDPLNALLQSGLISAQANLPQIAKFATKEVITKLFDSNKDALYHQDVGESMIESAVSNPNLDAFEFLLANLPVFQLKDVSHANSTVSKDTQISWCVKSSLQKSLRNENTKVLKSLLKNFPKINYLYPNGETLIHLAISQGKASDFLEAVFEKVNKNGTETDIEGVSFIDKQSKKEKNQTALHICIKKKQTENLKVLLQNSADPFSWDSQANTALHYSVSTNEIHFVETICNATQYKAKLLQQTNADNHSALHLAVKVENPKIVEFLLNSSSPFYPVMVKEPTLLHLAIRITDKSAQTKIMEQLFKHENAEHVKFPMTQLSDDKGYPPLHLATHLRENNAVRLLLNTDPSVLTIQDTRGYTPLHLSLTQSASVTKEEDSYLSIFTTILDNILAPCGEILDFPARDTDTTIRPHREKQPCCPSCHVICTQDNLKRTAMHYAIQHGRVEAFKSLLATGSYLFITDKNGYTLQHEAVKNGTDITFLKLLEKELLARTGGKHLERYKFNTV